MSAYINHDQVITEHITLYYLLYMFQANVSFSKLYWLFDDKESEYHKHTLQTNPGHLGEEPQNTSSHKTSGRQLK